MRQSPSDQAPLTVGACRKQVPWQRSPGSVRRAKPLINKEGATAKPARRPGTAGLTHVEKEGRKAGLVRNGSCCNASLEKVPASPAGPLAQSLSSEGLRQKWPGLVLPPGSTRVWEKSGQGMASVLRLGQTLEPPTPAGTQLALLPTAWSPVKGNLGIPPSWRIASLFPVLVAQMVKNLPAGQETWVQSLYQEDPLERGMATHPSVLAWNVLWTEEPGGLQSMGSQRVTHS